MPVGTLFYNLILYSLLSAPGKEKGNMLFVERLKGCGLPRGSLYSVCVLLVPVLLLDERGEWDTSARSVHLEAGGKIQNARPDRPSIPPTRLQRPQELLSRYTALKGIHL